ncbi:XRE family transcriptional regulator [Rouxiella silvae]|nr:S24 family peptidase [Rouxiella silvae]
MVEDEEKYKDFASRLNRLMIEQDVSVSALKNVCGVSYEMARRYTMGTAKPRDEKMIKIANHFGVSPAYLDYGVGGDTIVLVEKDTERLEQLDVFASAGTGYKNTDFPEIIRSMEIPKERIYELFGRKTLEGIKLINVDGDSMAPTLKPKDLLFIDSKIDHFIGDGVYVFNFEDSTFIKRLQRIKGRKLAVLSDNPTYPPFYIEPNEMHELFIFGRLIKHLPLQFNDFY